MPRKSQGQMFEDMVIRHLRRSFGCEVYVSETMDRTHKIDGEIRGVGTARLAKPVQVQLTRRIDHFGKLRAYLSTRWDTDAVVSVYVEVADAISGYETAEHIVWAAQEVQNLEPYGQLPVFGLRVDDDAVFFDPYARLVRMEAERVSPERLAALKSGIIIRYEENGFWIQDQEGGDTYYANYIDVFNSGFRGRLRSGVAGIPVRFLPRGPEIATDVRYMRTR